MSSEVRRYIPTNFRRLQRLYVLSECRRKVVGIIRRAIFSRKFVGNGRRNSDDFKFFVFVGNWSEIRHKRPTNFNPSEPRSEFGVFSCSGGGQQGSQLVRYETLNRKPLTQYVALRLCRSNSSMKQPQCLVHLTKQTYA